MAFSRLYRRDSIGGYDEERFENEVDSELLCPICLKVLKDPVQCPNEHYFCRSCIQKHLHENSETCPTCQHHLTETTLTKPPRILIQMLLGLKIRCHYNKRGCRELIKLEFLDRHIENCGYLPTRCTHPGCSQEINQRDKDRHESELCRFRMVVCDDCGQEILRKLSRVHPCFMRKDMDDMATRLNVFQVYMSEVKEDVKQMKLTQEQFVTEIKHMMIKAANQDDVADDLRRRNERIRHEMDTMRAEMACLTKESIEKSEWYTGRQRIFVCGGREDKVRHSFAESYSWPDNAWRKEPAMKEIRSGASAFVHEDQVFMTGGRNQEGKDTDSIESLNVDGEDIEWIKLPIKMPIKCSGHRMVCHENTAILTGGEEGENPSDAIYKIQLNPPYATKLLTKMPEPRCDHGCEMIDNQAVIVGGRKSKYLKDTKNTMYLYDINNNECKPMTPLPFVISAMATVRYKDNVILIGGVNEKFQTLNTVMMYDVKTGKTKMLSGLNHKRAASAAVIVGNVILVMGRYVYETKTYLDSVECLDLNTNVWRELSPMTTNDLLQQQLSNQFVRMYSVQSNC